jgi:hypothetical protein
MNLNMRLRLAGISIEAYHANCKTLTRMDLVTLKK